MSKVNELLERQKALSTRIRQMADRANDPEYTWTNEDEENWQKVNADFNRDQRQLDKLHAAEQVEAQTARYEAVPQPFTPEPNQPYWNGPGNFDLARGEEDPTLEQSNAYFGDHVAAQQVPLKTREDALRGWAKSTLAIQPERYELEAMRSLKVRAGVPHIDINLPRGDKAMMRAKLMYARYAATHGLPEQRRPDQRQEGPQSTSPTEGGEFIPEGFSNSLEIALNDFGPLRRVASVFRTATGNDLPWPSVNEETGAGSDGRDYEAAIIAENADLGFSEVVTGEVIYQAYKYNSKIVRVSNELMIDSFFDMGALLGRLLGERLGRGQNRDYTVGDGTGKPTGITVAAADSGFATSGDTLSDADLLIDLFYSVNPAYRNLGSAGFVVHDSTMADIRKLRDDSGGAGTGQYLWQPSLQLGQPDAILGKQVVHNNHMPVVGSGNRSVVFGDLARYRIREVATMRMIRMGELYAQNDQTGFVALMRTDGNLIDAGAGAVKYIGGGP